MIEAERKDLIELGKALKGASGIVERILKSAERTNRPVVTLEEVRERIGPIRVDERESEYKRRMLKVHDEIMEEKKKNLSCHACNGKGKAPAPNHRGGEVTCNWCGGTGNEKDHEKK